MRLVFFGTPEFAVPSLRALLAAGHEVAAVVTQPDKPQGRSRSTLVPPPVKVLAEQHGIPVLQPEKPVGDLFVATLQRLEPLLAVVVAYGHVLRPQVLSVPKLGMINVHASLLPAFRGAAPIQWAIAEGCRLTGVTIMQMEAGLDSGPMYHRRELEIEPRETSGALAPRLAELGAQALLEVLPRILAGTADAIAQDASRVTWAPKITRETARLDFAQDGAVLARRIRAFDPAPGAWATLDGAEVKFFGAREHEGEGAPGLVLKADDRLLVAAGTGALEVREVQPAGRKRMPVADWVRGRGVQPGSRFA